MENHKFGQWVKFVINFRQIEEKVLENSVLLCVRKFKANLLDS